MKKIIYISVIMLFNSCTDQAFSKINYTIFNQTDKNVKIIAFDTRNESTGEIYLDPKRAEEIIITPNSKFSVTRYTGLDDNTSLVFYSISGVDSVRIVFNSEKVKIYTRNPPDPCYICDGDKNHQYLITEEDYNTAENCNGNCE